MGEAIGSDLYRRCVVPDDSFDGISRLVWAGTPWMVNAWVGQGDERRRNRIYHWCRDRFGEEAFPFGDSPRAGRWREGSATVFGWTWFGFSTEAEMREFEAAWPAPADVGSDQLTRGQDGH